jgi:hypothetical protein
VGISLADILRRFAPAYQQRYPAALLPSHQRAIRDILACRTPALGGHLWHCPDCGQDVYVYHGCRNRACPARMNTFSGLATAWLATPDIRPRATAVNTNLTLCPMFLMAFLSSCLLKQPHLWTHER